MSVTGQKPIVTKKRRDSNRRTSKFVVPGGETLLVSPLKKGEFAKYLYNWLRAVKSFDEFTLCFVKDPTAYTTTTERVVTFPEGKLTAWESAQKGRKWIAEQVAEQLFNSSRPLVSFLIKREGIYFSFDNSKSVKPGSKDWEPYYEVLRTKEGEMNIE